MQFVVLLTAALLCNPQVPDTLDAVRVSAGKGVVSTGAAPARTASSDMIRTAGIHSMEEVLRTFAGVSVKDYGGIGGLKTVSIRNLGSQHTAVVYDGMIVSDVQNGQVDINRFDMEDVESVSVAISGMTDIFQSARTLASAGTLDIRSVSTSGQDSPFSAMAGMRAASFGTYNPFLRYRQKFGRGVWASVSANYLNSKGSYPFTLINGNELVQDVRLNSDVNALRCDAGIHADLGSGHGLDMRVLWYDSRRGLPGSVVYYTRNPVERLWDGNLIASASYLGNISPDLKLSARITFTDASNRYENDSAMYQVPEIDNYRQREYSAGAILQKSFSGGWKMVATADAFANTLWSDIPGCQFPQRLTFMPALLAQYDSPRFTVIGSLLGTFMGERVQTGDPAPDRRRLSPSLSAVCRLTESGSLKIRASVRDGFRVPTFNDLYYARVGNRNLEAEKALQVNAGLAWTRSRGRVEWGMTADAYYNSVKDKIVAVPTMFIWKMRNLGRVQMLGLDLSAGLKAALRERISLDVNASYSFQHAVDVTDPAAKNYRHQIIYTPRHTGSVLATLKMPWLNVSYSLTAVGKRYSQAQNLPANAIAAYADHGISLNRRFEAGRQKRLAIDAGLEVLNLLDVNYEVIRYYPMPGRNCRITLKITY